MTTYVIDLLNDQTNGIYHCYSDGSIYQVYRIPRRLIGEIESLEYINHPGVFMFFDKKSSNDGNIADVYITSTNLQQAENSTSATFTESQHVIEWTDAIFFTTENNTWGATELMYLENSFVDKVKEINRYNVVNNSTSFSTPTSKRTKVAMEEFITWAVNILGVLGYKILEPGESSTQEYPALKQTDDGETSSSRFVSNNGNSSYPILLHMRLDGIKALGLYDGKALTLIKGSTINPNTDTLCSLPTRVKRNEYLVSKSTNTINDDISFDSPNSAAEFVNGGPLDGYESWFDENEVCLKDVQNTIKASTSQIDEHILLYMTGKDVNATGWYNGNTFTVCKGSFVSPSKSDKCPSYTENSRIRYSDKIDLNYMVTEDLKFDSPSGAAGFVSYHSENGKESWKDINGVSLGELIARNKITRYIDNENTTLVVEETKPEPLTLYMTSRGSNATGRYSKNVFIVCKGSILCTEKSTSCSQHILDIRKQYSNIIDENSTLTEDISFKKPSAAAEFVALKSENGYVCWHDINGNTLNNILGRNTKRK